jgi:hypothetical protein
MLLKLLILKVGEAGEPTDYAIFAEQVAALLRCSVWSPRFSLRKELCRIHPSPPEDVVTPPLRVAYLWRVEWSLREPPLFTELPRETVQ